MEATPCRIVEGLICEMCNWEGDCENCWVYKSVIRELAELADENDRQ